MSQADKRIALYAGSFNPFTIGHLSIVERGLEIFDEIIVGIGINIEKPEAVAQARERSALIAKGFAGNARVRVESYDSLTGEFAHAKGCTALLRGVRGAADFEAETRLADANRLIFKLETFLIPALPELAWLSSTALRDLQSHGHDVAKWLAFPNLTDTK